jgi:hypothetical protein
VECNKEGQEGYEVVVAAWQRQQAQAVAVIGVGLAVLERLGMPRPQQARFFPLLREVSVFPCLTLAVVN